MPLDDVNALEYSCFALDQPIDLDWLGLDEPSGLSHTTLQSDLNTAQAIQQAGM